MFAIPSSMMPSRLFSWRTSTSCSLIRLDTTLTCLATTVLCARPMYACFGSGGLSLFYWLWCGRDALHRSPITLVLLVYINPVVCQTSYVVYSVPMRVNKCKTASASHRSLTCLTPPCHVQCTYMQAHLSTLLLCTRTSTTYSSPPPLPSPSLPPSLPVLPS